MIFSVLFKTPRIWLWLVTFALSGCKQESKTITVRGTLAGLPDDKLVMLNRSLKHDAPTYIDSVMTTNGRFTFVISRDRFPEPIDVHLTHYDKQGIQRVFDFPNNRKNYVLSTFMLEDGVEINGTLVEEKTPAGFQGPTTIRFVHPDRPITGSRQSDVMYNDTADFRMLTNVGTMEALVEQHPYSFYYLNIIKNRVADLTDAQFSRVFGAFDREVQESPTGRALSGYVATRTTAKLTPSLSLPDLAGQLQPIVNKDADRNVIVLWASWCGPCRQEIPELKKLYTEFNKKQAIHMVSISIDERADRWKKAVSEEKMPWLQLLMTDDVATHAREYFSYKNAVPLLIITDNQGRLLKRMEGYDSGHIAQIRAILDEAGQR